MWTLAIRTLVRRWGTGMLVLLELAIGLFCLTLAAATVFTATAMARKVSAFAPLETRIVGTRSTLAGGIDTCSPSQVEAGLHKLRQSFDVGAFYVKLQNDIGIDAQTAALFPLRVTDGRWLGTEDFASGDGAVPTILGFAVYPELSVGSTIPETQRVVVGRLQKGQTLITPSLAVLESIVSTDQLVLTPANLEPSKPGLARFAIFPKEGRAAALSDLPGEFITCINGSNTLQEDLNEYYKSRRPLMIVMGFVALVVLVIATLGFIGVAMMTVEKRTREFAIRLAVGATKKGLILQLVCELGLLSLLASLLSAPAAWVAAQALKLTVSASLTILINLIGVLLGIVAASGPVVTMLRRPPVFFIRGGR